MVCALLMHKKNTSKDCDRRDNNNNDNNKDVKLNHFFFMDDLKVCGKDYAEIEDLVSTVLLISQDK